ADSARHLPLPQELEELDALAQPAAHHFGALEHLAEQGGDLAAAEIEAPIERIQRLEDFGVAEMRVMQRRDLHAALIGQFGVRQVEPAILDCLAMQIGAGVRCGERHLDRVRVDLGGELDGFLDRLFGLAGEVKVEGCMYRDAKNVVTRCYKGWINYVLLNLL